MPASSMKRKRAFEKLDSAIARTKKVRVVRTLDGADRIDGYVVALSDEWVLLAKSNGELGSDGWTALRIRHTFSIDKLAEGDRDVQARVLAARGEWPPAAPTVCLINDLAGVIRTAQGASALVAVHRESARPDSVWVGMVRAVDDEHLSILELDSNAEWQTVVTLFDSDDITRVDFGGEYVTNLALVMGAGPGA